MNSSSETGKDMIYEDDNRLYEEYIKQPNRKSFFKILMEKKWWILVILWLLSIIVALTVYLTVHSFVPEDIVEGDFQIDAFKLASFAGRKAF